MSEDSPFNILDFIPQQCRCSLCNRYLSCGPIRVISDGTCICGHCSPSNTDIHIYRVLPLEAILSKVLFPCNFKQYGCTETVLFGEAADHELKCVYQPVVCPIIRESCSWVGSTSQLLHHFTEKHVNLLTEIAEFKIQKDQNVKEILMIVKEGIGFIIKYSYDTKEGYLKYDIKYCERETVSDASCKIELVNDEETECRVILKTNKCQVYDTSFSDRDTGIVLDLNKFLDVLGDPNCITIVLNLRLNLIENGVNFDLIETLRCHKCQNYLVTPLFDLDDAVICSVCAKQDSNSTPTKALQLQELVCKAIFPCRWHGCEFVAKRGECLKHEMLCVFRTLKCWFLECKKYLKLSTAIDHYKQCHNISWFSATEVVYSISFSQESSMWTHRYISKEEHNIIFSFYHRTTCESKMVPYNHSVALRSSHPFEVSANIIFKHDHCKLKSKQFCFDSKNDITITLKQLPSCFEASDTMIVVVNIIMPQITS